MRSHATSRVSHADNNIKIDRSDLAPCAPRQNESQTNYLSIYICGSSPPQCKPRPVKFTWAQCCCCSGGGGGDCRRRMGDPMPFCECVFGMRAFWGQSCFMQSWTQQCAARTFNQLSFGLVCEGLGGYANSPFCIDQCVSRIKRRNSVTFASHF